MAKKKGSRSVAVQGPALAAERAAILLRTQIEKGKQILASRPIESATQLAWETVTRDVLIRAYGSASTNVESVMDVGKFKFAFGGGTEQEYEQARAENMETRIKILDGLVELLDSERVSAEPAPVDGLSQKGKTMPTDLDVVLSWSGKKSKLVAEAFYSWLPDVLPGIKPWMSSENISKGRPWFGELQAQLEATRFCIICLTLENIKSPWLYFEAGAIVAKKGDTGVCSYLVGVDGAHLNGTPFAQFQWTVAQSEDTWRMVRDVNRSLPTPHNVTVLEGHFRSEWVRFSRELERIGAQTLEQKEDGSGTSEVTPARKSDQTPALDDNDVLSLLESWMVKRSEEENSAAIAFVDVDKALNLPAGASQRLLEQAAKGVNYVLDRKGANTIKFRKVMPESHAPFVSNPPISQRAERFFGSH